MSEFTATPALPLQDAVQPTLPGLGEAQDKRLALLEAVIFAAEEPPTLEQLSAGLGLPLDTLRADLDTLRLSCKSEARGLEIRSVGGGYRIFTKPEHHDAVRAFAKTTQPRLRLSLPALETLAVVAYRQPVTIPEIQAVRGVNTTGVIHTLLRHKLITTAGRKKVIGRPMRYKTTNEFLVHFGLNDLSELPSLKEMEELSRAAMDHDFAVPEEIDAKPGTGSTDGPSNAPETLEGFA